jgi:hypothetical protein
MAKDRCVRIRSSFYPKLRLGSSILLPGRPRAVEDFVKPVTMSAKFTHIEITMFAGRSGETKRALHKAIVRNLEPFGVPPSDVKRRPDLASLARAPSRIHACAKPIDGR